MRAHPALLAGAVLAAGFCGWLWWQGSSLEVYRRFERSDGAFRVVVLRQPSLWAMMPGQSSDAPGKVRLFTADGRQLAQADIEMVQLADTVDWSNDHAAIKLVVDWDLKALSGPRR